MTLLNSMCVNRMWLSDKQSSVVARVSRRISDATYLDLRTAEPLQVKQVNVINISNKH